MDCGSYTFCLNYMSYLDVHIQWHISMSLNNLSGYLWRVMYGSTYVMVPRMFYCVEQAVSDPYCSLPGCDATVCSGPDYTVPQPRGPQDNLHLCENLKLCITLWDLRFSQQCGWLLNSRMWCCVAGCVFTDILKVGGSFFFSDCWIEAKHAMIPQNLKNHLIQWHSFTCQNTQVLTLPCRLFSEVKEYCFRFWDVYCFIKYISDSNLLWRYLLLIIVILF